MSKTEWYYSSPPPSPTLFEADAQGPPNPPPKPQPFDLFAPFQPVEPLPAQAPEPEYFGASDTETETITPEAAFLKFASHVYAPADIVPVSELPRKPKSTETEGRKARIARLVAEIEELEQEGSGGVVEDEGYDFSALRRQLADLEKGGVTRACAAAERPLIEDGKGKEGVGGDGKEVKVQLVSPDVATVVGLERRVAELERMVGVSQADGCRPMAVAGVMEDVRRRLELLEDSGVGERLKREAREIAEVLRREVQSDGGVMALQTGEILRKMERWEELAETVPVVVERLRCLKRVHDEAGGVVEALRRVEGMVEDLKGRRGRNEELIANVEQRLRENMQTVQRNLETLEKRMGISS